MLGYSGHVIVLAIWKTSRDTLVGSFFVTEVTCYSPSYYVQFGLSEWYFECLLLSSSFISFFSPFSSSMASTLGMSQLQQTSVPLQVPLPDVGINTDATLNFGPFIFRVLGFFILHSGLCYPAEEPGQVLSARFILPCKNSRLMD